MKVLILSDFPFVGKGHKSGATVATQRIAQAVTSYGCQVEVYSSYYWGPGEKGDIPTIKRTKWDILRYIDLYTLVCMLRFFFSAKIHLKKRLVETLKISELGYLNHIIKKGNYDIVHSNDFHFMLCFFIKQVKRVPIFTIHGISNGLEELDCPDLSYRDYFHELERYEYRFYEDVLKNNYWVTFVSTGLKNHVERLMGRSLPSHSIVIGNMIDSGNTPSIHTINVRQKYNITPEDKILVCTGTVSIRKNQTQLIRAFSKLIPEVRGSVHLLIVGNDEQIDLNAMVSELGIKDRVHIVGFVYPNEMNDYYEQADGVVVPSLYETFGMSIIESYEYGLPVAVSNDLDAFEDVYNERGCVVIKDRSDGAICDAIIELVEKKWDKDEIKKLSRPFSEKVIGEKYLEFYRNYLKSYKSIS